MSETSSKEFRKLRNFMRMHKARFPAFFCEVSWHDEVAKRSRCSNFSLWDVCLFFDSVVVSNICYYCHYLGR